MSWTLATNAGRSTSNGIVVGAAVAAPIVTHAVVTNAGRSFRYNIKYPGGANRYRYFFRNRRVMLKGPVATAVSLTRKNKRRKDSTHTRQVLLRVYADFMSNVELNRNFNMRTANFCFNYGVVQLAVLW